MRIALFTPFVLLLTLVPAASAQELTWGASFSLTQSRLHVDASGLRDISHRTYPQLGAILHVKGRHGFGVQIEPGLAVRGGMVVGDGSAPGRQWSALRFLEFDLPVLATWSRRPTQYGLFVNGGPYVATVLTAHAFTGGVTSRLYGASGQLDAGFVAGVGRRFDAGTTNVSVELRYTHGLNAVHESGNDRLYARGIGLRVGFTIPR